jgi:hypothetical protein
MKSWEDNSVPEWKISPRMSPCRAKPRIEYKGQVVILAALCSQRRDGNKKKPGAKTEPGILDMLQFDARQACLAAQWRAETTMAWEWSGKRIRMGHWKTAPNAVRNG